MLRIPAILLACAVTFAVHAQQLTCSATLETVVQQQGDTVVFCDTPVEVYASKKTDGPVFLNFGGGYPDADFVVVVFSEVAGPDRDALVKRLKSHALRVHGVVKLYKGKPQIILKSMSDLEVE